MARTAQQIQLSIDTIRGALDSGVLSVGHGTDKVVFQSPESMRIRLRELLQELDAANGVTPRPRVNYIEQTSKGFGSWCDNE